MADDDKQAPQQRYWFPYWTIPPAPAPRQATVRPQPSRRDTRPAPPPVTPSPSRRQPQATQQAPATAASRGAGTGGAGSTQAQPQPTRLSSRPSPARAHPLSPIREPNRSATPAPESPHNKEPKPLANPTTPPQPAAPKELDIVVPQPEEKIIHEPPSDTKAHTHSKAVEKEKEKDKEKHKEKEKEGKEKGHKKDHKEKKEKDEHKEKKDKDKEHKETKKDKDKHKEEHEESKLHGGKLHKELKAGVADMVHKLGATAAPSASAGGHERHESGPVAGGTTVITLGGENKGASMNVSHGESFESKEKDRRARKLLDDGKQEEAHGGAKGITAFVNSNVQVVNNSLVLQSSCSTNDPGVHLKLSTKAKKDGGLAAAAKKK